MSLVKSHPVSRQYRLIEFEAQSWGVRQLDMTICDSLLRPHQLVAPLHFAKSVFQAEDIVRCRGEMGTGHGGHWSGRVVRRDRDSSLIRLGCDASAGGQSGGLFDVWHEHVHGVPVDVLAEPIRLMDALPTRDPLPGLPHELAQGLDVAIGHRLFEPVQIQRLYSTGDLGRRFQIESLVAVDEELDVGTNRCSRRPQSIEARLCRRDDLCAVLFCAVDFVEWRALHRLEAGDDGTLRGVGKSAAAAISSTAIEIGIQGNSGAVSIATEESPQGLSLRLCRDIPQRLIDSASTVVGSSPSRMVPSRFNNATAPASSPL